MIVITPLAPSISASLNRTTHSQWFNQEHYMFLYGHTKNNRKGGRKNKRTNIGLGQLQVQEGEVYVTFLCNSLCICRLSRACIFREKKKPLTMLTSSRISLPGLCRSTGLSSRLSNFCWLFSSPYLHLLTASFSWLCPSLDCYLKPTVLFSSALLCQLALSVFSRTFLPSSTSGLAGDLALRPFVSVSHQNKEIVWVVPIQTETNCYASCHTILTYFANTHSKHTSSYRFLIPTLDQRMIWYKRSDSEFNYT